MTDIPLGSDVMKPLIISSIFFVLGWAARNHKRLLSTEATLGGSNFNTLRLNTVWYSRQPCLIASNNYGNIILQRCLKILNCVFSHITPMKSELFATKWPHYRANNNQLQVENAEPDQYNWKWKRADENGHCNALFIKDIEWKWAQSGSHQAPNPWLTNSYDVIYCSDGQKTHTLWGGMTYFEVLMDELCLIKALRSRGNLYFRLREEVKKGTRVTGIWQQKPLIIGGLILMRF